LPDDLAFAPVVLLYLRLDEFDLEFNLKFDLEEHKRSLAAAARTGRVLLLEPDLSSALRLDPSHKALAEHLSIGISVADAEPIRRALQQRFDLPFADEREKRRVVEPAGAREALESFRLDAGTPDQLVVLVTAGWATIVVADANADAVLREAADENKRRANWASLQAGPYSLVRLDVLVGERRLRSWLLADPPQEIVRAASGGAHEIAVVLRPLSEDPQALNQELEAAALFPVPRAPDALRALIR
jgi:hypothetical protein